MIKSESETRRVKMTKKLIKDSLMEILETKTLSNISVTELCERADVNRSTFYAYYDDLLSVVEEVEDEMIKMIPSGELSAEPKNMEEQIVSNVESLFKYVRKYSKFFTILLQMGDMNFKGRLMYAILKNFPIKTIDADTKKEVILGYIFAMNGVIGILQEWLQEENPMDERALAEMTVKMSFKANGY